MTEMRPAVRGWWNMACWNGLSPEQREFLRTQGYLEFGYEPEGECQRGAEVEVTTVWDEFPGSRFYCAVHAIDYLDNLLPLEAPDETHPDHQAAQ